MTAAPTMAGDLERRKQVRVRARRNLLFTEQQGEGRTAHVVKDPVTLRYYHLDEQQRYVVGLMDGSHTLAEIQKAFEGRFPPDRLTLEELEFFVAQLLKDGLVQNESPLAGRLLFERAEKHRGDVLRATLLNFFSIRLPLFDPDRLLERLLPWTRFLFSWPCLLLGLAMMLAALGLVATHWGEFLARLPAGREFFRFPTVLYLWLAVGLVKVLHELGHGLCCKGFGGRVREMGALLLFFAPSLYCDVSDSWTLPNKWRRMAISAAGIYVELLIAAIATFVWWLTDAATVPHQLSLALMVVCSVNTLLLNANPLMRLDGYYVLSDWLEIPNLSEEAARVVQAGALRWLGVAVPPQGPATPLRQGLLACYSVGCYVYRWVVLIGCFGLFYTFLKPHKLGPLGYVVGVAALATMLGWPAYRLLRSVHRQGRVPEMKAARVWWSAGIVTAAVVVICLVPFPVRVQGVALLQPEPDQVQRIAAPEVGGFLKQVLVRDGARVRPGDVVAVLTNPELEMRLQVNEADQALRQQQKAGQQARLSDAGIFEGHVAQSLQQTEFELRALRQEHATLQEQADRLVLRAPCPGVVQGLASPEDRGRWLDKGTEVCRIADDRALRAVFLVEPADRELVARGSPAWVRVHGGGAASWPAVVTEVAEVEAKNIPPQLSNRSGGEVATQQDPVSRAERPYSQHYLSAVRLQRGGDVLHPGAMGRVKVEAEAQTLLWRCRRYLATTFNWGL